RHAQRPRLDRAHALARRRTRRARAAAGLARRRDRRGERAGRPRLPAAAERVRQRADRRYRLLRVRSALLRRIRFAARTLARAPCAAAPPARCTPLGARALQRGLLRGARGTAALGLRTRHGGTDRQARRLDLRLATVALVDQAQV